MAVSNRDMDGLLADLLKEPMSDAAPAPRVTPPVRQSARTTRTVPAPRAPLRRDSLDPLKTPSLILLGVLFLALSGLSTVMRTDDLLAVFGLTLPTLSAIALGVLIVIGVTWAEVLTSESIWYLIPLTIDVGFTVWWTWYGLHHAAARIGAPAWSAVAVGVGLGILSAWAPERILFGARRRRR